MRISDWSSDVCSSDLVDGEPYTMREGTDFRWYRSRMLGGRTNHWGRHVPRWGPYDFKAHSRDGLGVDWPIGYDDIAPFYDRVERMIGVNGGRIELENHPDSSRSEEHTSELQSLMRNSYAVF